MAIKKITFSFDIPITQLLGLIATGHAGMKIDVYGDDKPHRMNGKHLIGPKVAGLLEAPKKHQRERGAVKRGRDGNGNKVTGWRVMLNHLAERKDHNVTTAELGSKLVEVGLSQKSVSPQLTKLRQDGFVRRMGPAEYRITPRGVAEHAKSSKIEATP